MLAGVKAVPGCQSDALARRAYSITKAADFSQTLSTRQRLRSPLLWLNYAVNPTTTTPRLGLSVSLRLTKTAVQRNRVRRCLAETFRRQRASLPKLDLVVSLHSKCVSPQAARAAANQLDTLLTKLPT